MVGARPADPTRGHRAQLRHGALRHRSEAVGAGRRLQGARPRQPLRRRRELLPVVERGEPGADDDRQRAARRGPSARAARRADSGERSDQRLRASGHPDVSAARDRTAPSIGMSAPVDRPANVLVAYYSATGNVHGLAKAVRRGAEDAGAEVRLRHVEELASEMVISQNQAWGRHRSEVTDEPVATLEDLEWADGIAVGTPTRFGNVAAQLKMFLDQAGGLWEQGKLINKVATSFTSSQTDHGGQESTILALNNTFYHWGAIVLPLGYTVHEVFNGGGNPYGASYTSGTGVGQLDPDTLAAAVAQGARLASVARVIASAQDEGLLNARSRISPGSRAS